MKGLVKKLKVLPFTLMGILSSTTVFAAPDLDPKKYTGGDANVEGIEKIGGQLITILSTIGSIASVIVLIILGLKYMMGSAEEKAEYKKTLMPYILGAALIFAASTIAGMVFSFTKGLGVS